MTELEALGGHYVLLCSFGDEIVHGGSAIGEKIINDKDLLGCFGSLIQSECHNSIAFNFIVHFE